MNNKAFTIIELVIILTIIMLIASVFIHKPKKLSPLDQCKSDCFSWGKTDYVCVEKCLEIEGENK